MGVPGAGAPGQGGARPYLPGSHRRADRGGANALTALSLIKGSGNFSSVRARSVLTRCASRPFGLKESSRFTESRNEYLHGPGVPFLAIPPKVWWPKFWAQVDILVQNMDKEMSDLVGSDREPIVNGRTSRQPAPGRRPQAPSRLRPLT